MLSKMATPETHSRSLEICVTWPSRLGGYDGSQPCGFGYSKYISGQLRKLICMQFILNKPGVLHTNAAVAALLVYQSELATQTPEIQLHKYFRIGL